ncbi:unnamed protein product [Mytilus coruscus]|uniref:Protein SREK1IP1 n=1 Tax=Mytilus coruscus TaxID=42192 RepID=A0A6J8DXW0_MYTCO|nr:unnamed protein product [Mytilus coruscus]
MQGIGSKYTNKTNDGLKPACKKCGYAGHLTFQCRNFVKADPGKDIVLDVSSTSSDTSEDDFISPLSQFQQEKYKTEETKKKILVEKKKKKKHKRSRSRSPIMKKANDKGKKRKKHKKHLEHSEESESDEHKKSHKKHKKRKHYSDSSTDSEDKYSRRKKHSHKYSDSSDSSDDNKSNRKKRPKRQKTKEINIRVTLIVTQVPLIVTVVR